MRTTVTLEPDVAARLKELMHRRRASFKETLNRVLRRGLSVQERAASEPEPFVVQPHDGRFLPGIDLDKLNQLNDELEVRDALARASGRGSGA